jgi:hypothetical protein
MEIDGGRLGRAGEEQGKRGCGLGTGVDGELRRWGSTVKLRRTGSTKSSGDGAHRRSSGERRTGATMSSGGEESVRERELGEEERESSGFYRERETLGWRTAGHGH